MVYRIGMFVSYLRNDFNYLCNVNVEVWRNDIKCKYKFLFPLKTLARKGLTLFRCQQIPTNFNFNPHSSGATLKNTDNFINPMRSEDSTTTKPNLAQQNHVPILGMYSLLFFFFLKWNCKSIAWDTARNQGNYVMEMNSGSSRIIVNPVTDWKSITHCGLVTSYGDRDLGQHWLR